MTPEILVKSMRIPKVKVESEEGRFWGMTGGGGVARSGFARKPWSAPTVSNQETILGRLREQLICFSISGYYTVPPYSRTAHGVGLEPNFTPRHLPESRTEIRIVSRSLANARDPGWRS